MSKSTKQAINLVDSFSEFKEFKNINRETMMKVLQEVFRTIIKKKYGSDDNFDITVNTDRGDLQIWRMRKIVDDCEIEDPQLEIGITEAQKIEQDFEIGEEVQEPVGLIDFGRRAILAARQTLISRIMELEKDELYKKYKDRVGDIIVGEVYQIWKRELLILDDEGNELILPKQEMIRSDFFKKSDNIRAIVKEVDLRNNNPVIRLSRTDSNFLAKLMELEVPEIFDGLITIKKIVRQPGERAKVAVESYDDRIDPVGACVGMKGSRIHGIVRELRNENIDIINYTNNTTLFIQRCLTPAKINSMDIDEENKRVSVFLDPDQVSLAIGRGGLNIKLASRITGYEIDVYRDIDEELAGQEDILLSEFSDEIDGWVLDILKGIGLDTALSVLDMNRAELLRRSDLEDETVDDVLRILKEEFEEEDLAKILKKHEKSDAGTSEAPATVEKAVAEKTDKAPAAEADKAAEAEGDSADKSAAEEAVTTDKPEVKEETPKVEEAKEEPAAKVEDSDAAETASEPAEKTDAAEVAEVETPEAKVEAPKEESAEKAEDPDAAETSDEEVEADDK